MIVGVVNGSARGKRSNSERFLKEALKSLKAEEIREFYFNTSSIKKEDIDNIKEADVLVFAFGIYADGVPSHLLRCLKVLEEEKIEKDIKVYAICNCGFFEGKQCSVALDVIENWCYRAGFIYAKGMGIGAGESLAKNPIEVPPMKKVSIALKNLAEDISRGIIGKDVFVSPNYPRFLFVLISNLLWKKLIKNNGLKVKDLTRTL